MRICSLVPGATEVVAALGQAGRLVGISHECDFPLSIRHAPVLVEPCINPEHSTSAAIDREVRTLVSSGRPLYRLDERAFAASAPDVVLTQDLCHVCAVTPDQLTRAVDSLPAPPTWVTLNPTTLEDVISDVERIGQAIDRASEGRQLAASLRTRLALVRQGHRAGKPRVACLEWLSPLYAGGHWVPDMVELAGGLDVLGQVGQPSRQVTWEQVESAEPEIVILMPCGFSVQRAWSELTTLRHTDRQWSAALAAWPSTFVVDAASYFSRPGPRLVDGVEMLAALLSKGSDAGLDNLTAQAVPRFSPLSTSLL